MYVTLANPLSTPTPPEEQYLHGADFYLGHAQVDKNIDLAIHWLTLSAKQNFALAQNTLGHIYYFDKNYYLAAPQGNSASQATLGYMYLFGLGARQSDRIALNYFRQAAAQNYGTGLWGLGHMYENSKSVIRNKNRAKLYYGCACNEGFQVG